MKCIGKTKAGTPCGSTARTGHMTCLAHQAQEPETSSVTEVTAPTKATGKSVTFGSCGDKYVFVVTPRKTSVIDGNTVITQERKAAEFQAGSFTTGDPEIIAALRDHIAKHPNDRFLFER